MTAIIALFCITLLIVFSIAAYGMLAYHAFSIKTIWRNGWGTRLDALFILAGLLLTIKNLITL